MTRKIKVCYFTIFFFLLFFFQFKLTYSDRNWLQMSSQFCKKSRVSGYISYSHSVPDPHRFERQGSLTSTIHQYLRVNCTFPFSLRVRKLASQRTLKAGEYLRPVQQLVEIWLMINRILLCWESVHLSQN